MNELGEGGDVSQTCADLEGRPAPAVEWLRAGPPGDECELARWRAGVGPVRVARLPAGGLFSAPSGHDADGRSRGRGLGSEAPRGSASGSVEHSAWPLTVVGWNVHVGGGALRTFLDQLTSPATAREIRRADGNAGADNHAEADNHARADDHAGATVHAGSPPARPFVLLLQEAYSSGPPIPPVSDTAATAERIEGTPVGEPRTDIVSFARDNGLALFYAPSMRNGGRRDPREDRGSAILSNLPLARLRAIELPFERQRRVTLAARVDVAGTAVELCCAHLDNRAPWRRAWRGLGWTQARQVRGLVRALSLPGPFAGIDPSLAGNDPSLAGNDPPLAGNDPSLAGDGPSLAGDGPSLFAGDLNTWFRGRRQAAHALVRAHFPLPDLPDPRPTQHFELGGWLRTVDYLMARTPPGWGFDYTRQDHTFGSDHYPLVGTLRPGR